MDVKESYRVLELDIGASRAAVDAAFFRLIERWHPDRTASGGPEAVREAQHMVQAINDAYQTLSKIAPTSTAPTAPLPMSAAPATRAKPTLRPLPASHLTSSPRPPPPPPFSSEKRAARSAPVTSVPSLSTPAPTTPPPALRKLGEGGSLGEEAAASPTSLSVLRNQAAALYETLFPLDSPRRRYGPVIVAAALLFFLLLGKCAISSVFTKSPEQQRAADAARVAQTTGRLVVKSNRANTTIEAARDPVAGDTASAAVNGTEEGAAEQTLAALPPGKYSLTARSSGWPDIRQNVSVDAGRTTEVALNFKSGSLRLDSDPAGATVRLGTTVLGRTPLVIPQLPPGECQLSVEYPTWPVATYKTTITENMESTGTVRLPHGKLTVESTPSGAAVLLGGRALGPTPLTLKLFPAGTRKLTLQGKNFPPLEIAVTVEDRGELKVRPALASSFPLLDPAALLRAVWVPTNPDRNAPPLEGITNAFQSQNGIVRNLNRKILFEIWLRQRYCFTAIVKSYDAASGQIEFAEQPNELSKYRVLAKLSAEARNDQNLTALLIKGATFALYGRLSAVEEPRWPSKVITFEFSAAEPLR